MRFRDVDIESFWAGESLPRRVPADCRKALFRRLQMLDAARSLADLLVPPSNRLEKPSGNRAGQYSIRINRQWRLCFRWNGTEATEVEFVDYH